AHASNRLFSVDLFSMRKLCCRQFAYNDALVNGPGAFGLNRETLPFSHKSAKGTKKLISVCSRLKQPLRNDDQIKPGSSKAVIPVQTGIHNGKDGYLPPQA
ncbi:MAG: hypothetical protein KDE58_29955, partial [Caldilineaceae bacterium]|nr:hypothetical protein [Caldilineaceae bacterium]